MLSMIKKLMPKEEKFFDLFEAHAAKVKDASGALRAMLEGGPAVAANATRLMALEDDADRISDDVMQAIRKSFITPFDRSDIKALISSMDDAIDQMNKTAKAVLLFEQTQFEPQMRAMGDIAVKMAGMMEVAVPLLREVNTNSSQLHTLTADLIRTEEESDHLNDAGMKALVIRAKASGQAMDYIIGAELYDHLEKVADRFEDVANVINGIVIEHV